MKKFISQISLTVKGPFLTASTGPEIYGLQKAFHRDYKGHPVIPSSHIKGKVRMALEELASSDQALLTIDIPKWFGQLSGEYSYEPVSGSIRFSDFVCQLDQQSSRRSRIAINHKSLTAAEYQLRDVEELFKSGTTIIFNGFVTFFADNDGEARNITNVLRLGLGWLTNLGAEKGVGFGRLLQVQVSIPEEEKPVELNTSTLVQKEDRLHLRIKPLEPIIIGGVKKPRTNYVQSETVLSGGLIKGALANCLNQTHGVIPSHTELTGKTSGMFPEFPKLVKNFAKIRISHAFPAGVGQPRPVRMPVSAVKVGEDYKDTSLSPDRHPLVGNHAPAYFIDWKTPKEYFGCATPKEIFVTRTEIADESRRSLENRLFTYSFLCPEEDDGEPVEWICNVDFSGIENVEDRRQTKLEFARAVHLYLDRLGKLNHRVRVEVNNDYAKPAEQSEIPIKDGWTLISLQTDALMLDPEQVRRLHPGDDLLKLYSEFWRELSDGCMELKDFYAHQTFKGGYVYHRYLGASERKYKENNYHPYYLTGAGSVFKLQTVIGKEAETREYLTKWLARGLSLPKWAKKEYSQYDRELWQNCPYTPENGYGEIIVNLSWHWGHQI